MLRFVVALLVLSPIGKIAAEVREFTSVDGNSIFAEVEGFEGTSVKLKVGTTTYKVPVSKLSEPDKDYLREWLKNNVQYSFRFSVFEKEGNSPGESSGGFSFSDSVDLHHYLVNITNDSGQDVEAVKMEYRAFVKRTVRMGFSGTDKSYEQHGGVTNIELLKNGSGTLVPTGTIKLENFDGNSERTTVVFDNDENGQRRERQFTETKKNRSRSELMGIWIRLYHENKLVGEYKKFHSDVEKSSPIWEENPQGLQHINLFSNERIEQR